MGWNVTDDLEEFAAAADGLLHGDRVGHTVPLTVLEVLRVQGTDVYGQPALFGWWSPNGGPAEAILLLSGGRFELMLSDMPGATAAELAGLLVDRNVQVPGVHAAPATAEAFAAAWAARTGVTGMPGMRQRLYRLAELRAPEPMPPGEARVATEDDFEIVREFFQGFERDAHGAVGGGNPALVRDRIGFGGVCLWEVDGEPVAVAGRTRVVAGMARVAPVYTPPEHRRHGYGSAATVAVSQVARAVGAEEVVLFTDLGNPTSNSIYQAIGYRPVADRLVISFGGAGHGDSRR